MYLYIDLYIHIHIYIYIYTYIYILHIHIYIHIRINIHIHIYTYTYTHTYIYIHIHIYIYTYLLLHTFTRLLWTCTQRIHSQTDLDVVACANTSQIVPFILLSSQTCSCPWPWTQRILIQMLLHVLLFRINPRFPFSVKIGFESTLFDSKLGG